MKLSTIVTSIATAIVASILTATPAHAEDPQRILIVGDSVTQGDRGDYTWRYFLDRQLRADGTSFDFVGSTRGVFYDWDWNYTGPDAYADPYFDQDHAATGGGTIELDGHYLQAWPVAAEVATHDPDVVVSLWAHNDLATQTVDTVLQRYRDWLGRARSSKPTVDFVVGRLTQTWRYDGRIAEFNDRLDELAGEQSTPQSTIVVADAPEGFTVADTKDDVHPNTAGQQKIAAAVHEALARVPAPDPEPAEPTLAPAPPGVSPPAPEAAKPVVKPVAPRKVKAVQHGKRVRVTWRSVARAESYVVRCGRAAKTVTGTRAVLRTRSTSCRVRAVNEAGASSWKRARVRA